MDLINYLMDEALIEIFGYLSHKTIKNCSLVCKRWNDIISNSREIMDKFQIEFTSTGNCGKEVRRKHYKITSSYINEDFLDIIRYHNLHTLELFSYSVKLKLSDLVNVLNNVPQLKILRVHHIADFINDIQDVKNAPKVRLNLIELECEFRIIHIVECDTIKKLRLHLRYNAPDPNRQMIFDFMNRQKNLHSLKVISFDLFKDFDSFTCQYQLKSFSSCPYKHEELIMFLALHKNSLEFLELFSYPAYITSMEEIQKYVFTNMPNLKELNLKMKLQRHVERLNEEPAIELLINEPYHATFVTRNIERLAFDPIDRSLDENKRFVDLFQNIKHLSLLGEYYEHQQSLLHYISTTKLSLESLDLIEMPDENGPIFFFPNLKVFTVYTLLDEKSNLFIKRHSRTLEEIHVKDVEGIKQSTVKEINKCKNLKKIMLRDFDQENCDQVLHVLSEYLDVSQPLEIVVHDLPYWSTTFKLPEDYRVLKSNQIFKYKIKEYWNSLCGFLNFLFSD